MTNCLSLYPMIIFISHHEQKGRDILPMHQKRNVMKTGPATKTLIYMIQICLMKNQTALENYFICCLVFLLLLPAHQEKF